jgi:hypothetical protein
MESHSQSLATQRPAGRPALPQSTQDRSEQERFAAEIARAVQRATRGSLRELRVEIDEQEGVVLHGRCSTYYCKQLAQHAAMGASLGAQLDNRIEVC